MFDEGEKKERICVKCQLSALSLLFLPLPLSLLYVGLQMKEIPLAII
jgi:hypothetical protein